MVVLFSNPDLTGLSYIVHQGTSVWLQEVPFGLSHTKKWNDEARSIQIVVTKQSRLLTLTKGYQPVLPSPYCVALYSSNPFQIPESTVFLACGDPSHESGTILFTQATIKGLVDYSLKDFGDGVSYIVTGSKASITIFDGGNCFKDYDNMATIAPNKKVDLESIPLKGKDQTRSWGNLPLSFALVMQ